MLDTSCDRGQSWIEPSHSPGVHHQIPPCLLHINILAQELKCYSYPLFFLAWCACICVAVMDEGEGPTVFMLKLITVLSVSLVDPSSAFPFCSLLLHLLISVSHIFNAFSILNDLIFTHPFFPLCTSPFHFCNIPLLSLALCLAHQTLSLCLIQLLYHFSSFVVQQ